MRLSKIELLRPQQTHLIVIGPEKADPAVDLCALTLCDHMAMSTGTFGFWASYLGKGMVTYQKEYARNGSNYYKLFTPKDYYLPEWIPL